MEGVVLGATGLVGRELVRLLLKDPSFLIVRALVRTPLNIDHPKFLCQVVDFNNPEELREKLGTGTALFCCIGTTMKQVKGDKEAYKRIDYDIAINAARFASENNFRHFAIVSAASANAQSKNFYNRLKGKIEEDLASISIPAIHIFRPSVLLGERSENRPAEKLLKQVAKALSLFLPSRYKPIEARQLAAAMIAAVKKNKSGTRKYEYKQMMRLIR